MPTSYPIPYTPSYPILYPQFSSFHALSAALSLFLLSFSCFMLRIACNVYICVCVSVLLCVWESCHPFFFLDRLGVCATRVCPLIRPAATTASENVHSPRVISKNGNETFGLQGEKIVVKGGKRGSGTWTTACTTQSRTKSAFQCPTPSPALISFNSRDAPKTQAGS